ncbi:helix-turn-helix domain-containing protein [Gordonia polyisoprenivorans]|uniref:helix-turn-helix domain-containing protein n=1 Tax=Gordonia polyisoprenivorans TaxID=84595 RepID=UPI001AD7374B|nr:helix-turn-helix domain-containing protein [Gordonia polyisoprenivorans]QTI69156.1 TetR/AcrR family transcriptional regulator [Gordonia polyisoprenivorans]
MCSAPDEPAPAAPPKDDLSSVPLKRTPTQSRSREKVSKALAAADRIAVREGVDALTLTRVAEEAGLSVGALHQYLPDRDAIAAALVARYHERIENLMDDVIDRIEVEEIADPVAEVIGHIAGIYTDERSVQIVRSIARLPGGPGRAHKARMAVKVCELMQACGLTGCDMTVARTVFAAADAVMHEAFSAVGEDGATTPDTALLAELEDMIRAYLDRR